MNITPNTNAMNTFQTNVNQNAHDMAVTTTKSLDEENRYDGTKDIGRLLTDDIVNQDAFEAQTKPIQTQNEMYGTLLDMKV